MRDELEQNNSPVEWSKRMSMIAWRLHPASSVKDLVARAAAASINDEEREKATTALAFCNTKEAAEQMLELSKNKDQNTSARAKYWLAMRQNNDWAGYLDWSKLNVNTAYERKLSEMKVRMQILLDERQSDDERKWQTEAMVKDTIGAQMLIGLAAEKRLPAKLYPVVAGMIFLHEDPVIRTQAANYFKREGDDTGYDIASIVKLTGNIESGGKVFQTKCASCHVIAGKGGKIGPELTTISAKFDEENLLRAIIYPDEGIVFGYEPWMVNTKDNESVFGFLVSDDKQRMVIKDLTGLTHVFNKNEIASAKKQPKSLMPSAKDNALTEQELKDVVEFLKK
jgi:putative heme-binding domain-containing protein